MMPIGYSLHKALFQSRYIFWGVTYIMIIITTMLLDVIAVILPSKFKIKSFDNGKYLHIPRQEKSNDSPKLVTLDSTNATLWQYDTKNKYLMEAGTDNGYLNVSKSINPVMAWKKEIGENTKFEFMGEANGTTRIMSLGKCITVEPTGILEVSACGLRNNQLFILEEGQSAMPGPGADVKSKTNLLDQNRKNAIKAIKSKRKKSLKGKMIKANTSNTGKEGKEKQNDNVSTLDNTNVNNTDEHFVGTINKYTAKDMVISSRKTTDSKKGSNSSRTSGKNKTKSMKKANEASKTKNMDKINGASKAKNMNKTNGASKTKNMNKINGASKTKNMNKTNGASKTKNMAKTQNMNKGQAIQKQPLELSISNELNKGNKRDPNTAG